MSSSTTNKKINNSHFIEESVYQFSIDKMTNSHFKKFNLTKSNQNFTTRKRFTASNNSKLAAKSNFNSKTDLSKGFRSDLSLEICSLEYSRW